MPTYQEMMGIYEQLKNVKTYEQSTAINKQMENLVKRDVVRSGTSVNDVSVTVTPQPTYGMEWTDWASLVFPPALLWKATDPTPVGGSPMPTTTVSGDPGAVSEFLSTSPLITTTEKEDPFSGLTDISNMVMKIAPVLLVFALIGGLKKVF